MALEAGADVVMPNYTPLKYREHYEIYPNKRCITEDPEHCHSLHATANPGGGPDGFDRPRPLAEDPQATLPP